LIGEGDELDVPAGYVFDDDESDGILTEAFKTLRNSLQISA